MKTLYFLLFVAAFTISGFSQKKGENNKEPWLETIERSPFQQGKDGSILLEIKNTGTDITNCIEKAKQQAVFSIIFKGYQEANNIPASPALSPTEDALYFEKIDFFKEFFTNTSQYGSYVPKAEPNPAKPVSKLDKRTVEASIIVTIEVNRLRSALERQNIIKSLADFGFTPKIIVVPSNEWMGKNGYVSKKDNQGIAEEIYDYNGAINDVKISGALSAVKSKYNKSSGGPFEVVDIKGSLDKLKLETQKNNARSQAKQESSLDIFSRVLAGDLWVKVDIKSNPLSGGLEKQILITLTAYDPYTGSEVLSGKTIEKTTKGDNEFQLMANAMNGACDELRVLIFNYFKERTEKGIQGEIVFSLSESSEFNFNTEFDANGESKPLNEILKKLVKKPCTSREEKSRSETKLEYTSKIPMFYEEDGEKEKNSFINVGNRVRSDLKKIGFTCTPEPNGIGCVEIIITGKTQ